jgi:hypothetical protein
MSPVRASLKGKKRQALNSSLPAATGSSARRLPCSSYSAAINRQITFVTLRVKTYGLTFWKLPVCPLLSIHVFSSETLPIRLLKSDPDVCRKGLLSD